MAYELNFDTDNIINQTKKFNIESKVYNIHCYYNYRSGWYLGLYSDVKEAIKLGVRMMPGGLFFDDTDLFSGVFICVDTDVDSENEVITRDNFGQGKRYQIWYFTETDIKNYSAA
jgi:hypothetical protein